MPFINFTKAELRGPAVDQAVAVAETANLQLRVYTEVGNGDGGNGGADGSLGLPLASQMTRGFALAGSDLFYLEETAVLGGEPLPNSEVLLRLRVVPSAERYPGSRLPLYWDLVLSPVKAKDEDARTFVDADLIPLKHYAFKHTAYLPGSWISDAFNPALDVATIIANSVFPGN